MQYPEHEKLAKVSKESNAVGGFLDWLVTMHDVELPAGITCLLEDYYEIDSTKLENEKRLMLRAQRRLNIEQAT